MKPILFNTAMVRAILDGRKSVTRRAVKLKYSNTHLTMHKDKYGTRLIELQNEEPGVTTIRNPDDTTTHRILAAEEKVPPYRPGNILYVRETWNRRPFNYDEFIYKADGCYGPDMPWRPSIHMPKEAARLFLRVTDVRVERLQNMTAQDSLDEGVKLHLGSILAGESALEPFKRLWDSTIKKADLTLYGWAANPYVWCVSFERIPKEEAYKDAH